MEEQEKKNRENKCIDCDIMKRLKEIERRLEVNARNIYYLLEKEDDYPFN